MKAAIILLSVLAVASAEQAGSVGPSTLEEYKPKIVASLEWVKTLLNEFEQKTLPTWTINNNTDSKNTWVAVLTGVKVSGVSSIAVKSVVTDPKTQTINIVAKIPKITIQGQYSANGMTNGNEISGNGDVTIDIAKTNVMASLKLGTIWEKIKVDTVNLSFSIGDISVNAKNLKIQGTWFFMTNSKVSKLLLANVRKDTPRLSRVFGESLKIISNAFISGTRLADTKAWVTSYITDRIRLA